MTWCEESHAVKEVEAVNVHANFMMVLPGDVPELSLIEHQSVSQLY